MPTVQSFSALRARSYIFRLPLFTRCIILIIVAFWLVGIQSVWDLRQWGALIPNEIGIKTMYRTNTFPLIHLNFFHAFFNILALTPLLERFETEFGTLTSLALFFGREFPLPSALTTIPAFSYIFMEKFVFRSNTPVMGASMWVFLLLGIEAIRTYKTNPHLVIGTHHVPTWITPLVMVLVIEALIPRTSFIGHLCGVGTGYLFGLGYLKFLAPPEKALRWVEGRLNLLGRLPHYVSVDQKTYGRFGVLPTSSNTSSTTPMGLMGSTQRLAMPGLLSTVLSMRRDPRLLKLPPYLSLLCIIVGVAWLLMLPLDDYSRRTYISENALLPGQVHTYFGGSDQNVFRAYRHEVDALKDKSNTEINDELEKIFKGVGLKVGRQNYTYHSAGNTVAGENVYAILHAPRGDATEAIVLVAAWKNVKDEFNRSGLALALTLARYFRRWSLWSKDIILVVPPDSKAGTQAWVDAYHDAHDPAHVASLPIKSGALQGAVAIDYPQEGRFESVHIVYDGVNGQLPNLDLINSVVNIANGQMGLGTSIQEMFRHSNKYNDRLKTMLRGMLKQGLGHAAGPHSSFIPYHVDAITLQPVGQGWHDEMGLGRLVEGTFRSLNNLLEHLHQSFFFYVLMHKDRFVSIGTYLPSAMLIAANFTIMAIMLWVKSGHKGANAAVSDDRSSTESTSKATTSDGKEAVVPTAERDILLPLRLVAGCQFIGVIPLFIFNHLPSNFLAPTFAIFSILNAVLPLGISQLLTTFHTPVTPQHYLLTKSFSLLLLGMFLSALATLNFSLALLVGLLAAPLSFTRTWGSGPAATAGRIAYLLLLNILSPTAALLFLGSGGGSALLSLNGAGGTGVGDLLTESAFAWDVWGTYTPLVVWCVWWPAWIVGCVVTLGGPTPTPVPALAAAPPKRGQGVTDRKKE
ncbi:Gaa1-like protein [Xylariomycetidae sp. FL2044]|nr:Gaa1-like protein [Xylariomycetidae sp. FL2044]